MYESVEKAKGTGGIRVHTLNLLGTCLRIRETSTDQLGTSQFCYQHHYDQGVRLIVGQLLRNNIKVAPALLLLDKQIPRFSLIYMLQFICLIKKSIRNLSFSRACEKVRDADR